MSTDQSSDLPQGLHELNSRDEIAYDRRIIEALMEVMATKWLRSDAPDQQLEQLICEDVPLSRSNIPPHALHRIFNHLSIWENEKRQKLNEFQETRVVLPAALANPLPTDDPKPQKRQKKSPPSGQ